MESYKWKIKKNIPPGYESEIVPETAEFSSVDELAKVGFVRGWLMDDNKLHLDGNTLELVMRGGRFSNMYVRLGEIEGDIDMLKLQFDKYDTMAEIEWANSAIKLRKAVKAAPPDPTPSRFDQEVMTREMLCDASNRIDDAKALCDDVQSKEFRDSIMSAIGSLEKLLNKISGWNVSYKKEA